MKKILSLAIVMLFAFTAAIFAQTSGGIENFDPVYYYGSIPLLLSGVLFVTQLIRKFVTVQGKAAQYLSWGVSLLLCVVGYIWHWGILADVVWYYIFIYALALGLMANGLFDWEFIRAVLKVFGLLKEEKAY